MFEVFAEVGLSPESNVVGSEIYTTVTYEHEPAFFYTHHGGPLLALLLQGTHFLLCVWPVGTLCICEFLFYFLQSDPILSYLPLFYLTSSICLCLFLSAFASLSSISGRVTLSYLISLYLILPHPSVFVSFSLHL